MAPIAAKAFHILLIGGVSGVGKSETAAALARQLGISWLQVDDLRLALQFSGLISREQHPELFFFLDQNDWRTSPEIYRDKLIEVGRIVTGALRIVIESHIATNVPIILEGDGILPEFAAAIWPTNDSAAAMGDASRSGSRCVVAQPVSSHRRGRVYQPD